MVYCLSLPPSVVFEDAGMIAAVCYNSGVLHPPGYPLYTLLCTPIAHLGDAFSLSPATSTALLSAFFAAATCAMFYEICRRLAMPMVVAVAAAIALGLGSRFWSQAIIAEVYTLNAFLVAATMVAILRLLRHPTQQRFLWLCFLGGLGLANHWPLYLVNAPLFAILLATVWRQLLRPRLLLGGSGMLLLGLSPYLYLWQRANFSSPLAITTPPTDLPSLFAYISREVYTSRLSVEAGWAQCMDGAWWAVELLAVEYSLLGAAMAIYGGWHFYRRRPLSWSVAVLFGICATAPLLAAVLCEDINGIVTRTILAAYPLPAMIFLMLLIAEALKNLPRLPQMALAVALPFIVGGINWEQNNRTKDTLAAIYSNAILESLPPNAVLHIGNDFKFPVFYQYHALGVRSDIMLKDDVSAENNLGKRRFSTPNPNITEEVSDWGIIQELQPQAAELPPPPLLDFYRRLPALYSTFDNHVREWDRIIVRRGLFDAARMFTVAEKKGLLTEELKSLRDEIIKTPEGLFGKLSARLKGHGEEINFAEINDELFILHQLQDNFTPAWQAQIIHLRGVASLLKQQPQQAQAYFLQALVLDTTPDNPALIDALQLLAATRKWEEYANLRQRYWMVENPGLDASDGACEVAISNPCNKK